MSIFKRERESKRLIFNVYLDLAEKLDNLKAEAKRFDKRLDVDAAINDALEKFISKAEKKLATMKREHKVVIHKTPLADTDGSTADLQDSASETEDESADGPTPTSPSEKGVPS